MEVLNEQQVTLPERKTEDFVLLGMKGLNTYSFITEEEKQDADDSSESSSIGVQSSSSSEEDDEETGNEVQSKLNEEEKTSALASLDSLEDSLPIKRGLSNFFAGKSKSFATLSDASAGCANDLKKQENPFNKRRRILMAKKISRSRRASYSSLILDHAVNEREEKENEREEQFSSFSPLPKFLGGGLSKPFKSPRSFSLSDLQHV